jgi:RimJ/RimL family protein N-acetyltransferase
VPLSDPGTIDCARVQVRRVRESDLPALMDVSGDPRVTRFLPYETWTSPNDANAWYRRMEDLMAPGTALQLVVVEKRSSLAIGTCLLFRFEERSARAEIGYALAHSAWNKGYMREALTALVDCAFTLLSLRRLEAEVDPRNIASAGLMTRLGFTREGLLRERWITKGEPTDVLVFGLLETEWAKRG